MSLAIKFDACVGYGYSLEPHLYVSIIVFWIEHPCLIVALYFTCPSRGSGCPGLPSNWPGLAWPGPIIFNASHQQRFCSGLFRATLTQVITLYDLRTCRNLSSLNRLTLQTKLRNETKNNELERFSSHQKILCLLCLGNSWLSGVVFCIVYVHVVMDSKHPKTACLAAFMLENL